MAKDPKATPKGTRSARGKNATKRPRGERWRQLLQVYRMTRQSDRWLPLWMAMAFFGALGVVLLVLTVTNSPIYIAIPVSVLTGFMALLIIFGRRAQKAVFHQVEGQPVAAAGVLQQIDTSGPDRRARLR